MSNNPGAANNPPHIGPFEHERFERAKFDRGELREALSQYELPPIVEIRSFPRGSRRSPKARIITRLGEFLLKRRAPGRDDPHHVAFTQELEIHLNQRGYPAPRLLGTRDSNNSMLQMRGAIYELFEFIDGRRYDRSEHGARQAGLALSHLHRLLAELTPRHQASTGGYHAAAEFKPRIRALGEAVRRVDPATDADVLASLCQWLEQAYETAAARVDAMGFPGWTRVLCHGDWHPGNLLYRERSIVGVLDFDSARTEPRMADVANGALQFSMRMGDVDQPQNWPAGLEVPLLEAFLRGYDQAARQPLAAEERAVLAPLMIEALVLEGIVPIAATGMFGRIGGFAFLQMMQRTVEWMRQHAPMLEQSLDRNNS